MDLHRKNPLDIELAGLSRKTRSRRLAERLGHASAVESVRYVGNKAAANTDRLPSPNVWKGYPWASVEQGAVDGINFFDDFDKIGFTVPTTEGQIGPYYKAFSSTGGTIKAATPARGGIITLGSDGDDEGSSIATVSPCFQIVSGEGLFCFECRVMFNTIAVTKYDTFIGLGELMTLTAIVPITATAGALADKNLVGFLRPGTSTTGDGSIIRTTYKADAVTAVTVQDSAAAIAADAYVKLGMRFGSDNYLRFYINNIELSTKKLIPVSGGTDFPADAIMGPIAAVVNTAAATSLFTMDWWRFGQLAIGAM